MTTFNDPLPEQVVTAFKNILSDEARATLTDKEFHELSRIVREALSQELSTTADMIEELVKKLRSMTDHQDLDL